MAYRDKKSTLIKGWILVALLQCVYRLPTKLVRSLGLVAGYCNYWINGKATRVVRKNLEICYPELNKQQINQRIKAFLKQNAWLAPEIATAWLGQPEQITRQFKQVKNQNLIDSIVAQDKPLIIAVLHIGNWEMCWHWIQHHYPAFGMYQSAKFKPLDQYLLRARQLFGGKAFAANPKGIMGLLKSVKARDGIMTILPDQAPREGAGVYAPFYGHPAYTMTLLHKFVQKTGAELLFANAIRDDSGKGFNIEIEAANFDPNLAQVESFNTALNLQIESIVDRHWAQYQWSYKRFKRQADAKNPYK
ncbi:lysophospholipid acyltransferase family protein [Aliikangiella sp. IMCC44653]